MHAPLRMGQQHPVGVVAAVVDDHISGGHGGEMGERGGALIAVGMQVEVDGEFRAQFVEATQQALRIVGPFLRQGVAGAEQWARQVDLRAVDREDPVPLPLRALGTLEDLGVQVS